jgi:hypothetical protein
MRCGHIWGDPCANYCCIGFIRVGVFSSHSRIWFLSSSSVVRSGSQAAACFERVQLAKIARVLPAPATIFVFRASKIPLGLAP